MRAFIIRPFGTKEGVDFDAVDRELIDPALSAQHDPPEGRTTGDIVKAGNIRTDMFEQILTADLVIADVSIHNANVFYELGIRHALREKRTVLIRSKLDGHDIPFDLQTDRYVRYDHTAPGESLEALTRAIRETIASNEPDSPVFELLPNLVPVDPKRLVVVPHEFSEEVDRAVAAGDLGRLRLLAEEARGFPWETAGLRHVGRAQFDRKDWDGARDSFTAITKLFSDDVEANTRLGTVHQRKDDLTASSLALDRVLRSSLPTSYERAEARTLQARNLKTEWVNDWRSTPDPAGYPVAALRSGHLEACADAYEQAFFEDRNHFYSGLNALAMLRTTIALATDHPDVWCERLDVDDDDDLDDVAKRELRTLQRRSDDLAAAVKLSAASGIERLEREGDDDLVWARVSEADLTFLTTSRPERAAQAYREVLASAADFVVEAARKQVELYRDLAVFPENTAAAIDAIAAIEAMHRSEAKTEPRERRVIVFTGHRLDAPDRPTPRFPADREDTARGWIRDELIAEQERAGDAEIVGISGGASGGDILFHEVCAELGIPSEMYLAVPQPAYIKESVADGGPDWVRRFNDLQATTSPQILNEEDDLPPWLRTKRDYNIWQRSNLWMLHTAFARGDRTVLIALWNRAPGDGPGGTQDMVERANERGARVQILEAQEFVS